MAAQSRLQLTPSQARSRIQEEIRVDQLPVLRATVQEVLTLTTSRDGDARKLAQAILLDPAFSARLLAVANSPYYMSGPEPFTSVMRAVLQVGHNTVRDLAVRAETTDKMAKRLPIGVNLRDLGAEALVAAHQARALGHAARVYGSEELFTIALIQYVVRLALACFMPNEYLAIRRLMNSGAVPNEVAFEQALGLSATDVAVEVLRTCKLPYPFQIGPVRWSEFQQWSEDDRRHAVVTLACGYAGVQFATRPAELSPLRDELLEKTESAFGLDHGFLEQLLMESFCQAYSLGERLELGPESFFPLLRKDVPEATPPGQARGGNGQKTDGLLRPPLVMADTSSLEPDPDLRSPMISDPVIMCITDMIEKTLAKADLNEVMQLVLDGLHSAVGFDHAVALLLRAEHAQVQGWLASGPDGTGILPHFTLSADPRANVVGHCIATRGAIRIHLSTPASPAPPSEIIPDAILRDVNPSSVAVASLHLPTRTVGLIWAHRLEGEIDDRMWSLFQLFCMQSNLALAHLSLNAR